jgi:Ca-activated chloride channel homolog
MRAMKTILILISLVLSASFASAQMPLMISQPPSGVTSRQKQAEELRLARVNTTVRIHGWLAETAMTMTFSNPTGRNLAGDLYFPLPEGATLSGYALDVNGVMVDGVVVEKDKARQVFEKELRKGIDPGLVESVKGNNFKTRVFPIPPHGSRTVMVRYVSELIDEQGRPAYLLPLHFSKKVDEFRLRVEVVKGEAMPVVTSGGLSGLSFGAWRDSYVAETLLRNVAPAQNLAIALPGLDRGRVALEKSADGNSYFTIHDLPRILPAKPAGAPARVGILWDASASRGESNHEREREALRRFFARFPQAVVEVELTLFNNEGEKPRRFLIKNGDAGQLLEQLKQVFYDGGTRMSAIAPPDKGQLPDYYLLFSDGTSNFGAEEPARLPRPLYVFSDDARANHPFLRYLAMKSGGEYFNLEALTPATAAASAGAPAYSFISASYDGSAITDVTPALPQPVHGSFNVSGRLLTGSASLTLNYGIGGEVMQRVEYRLNAADTVPGEMGALSWGMKRLEELLILPKRNHAEITAIGKRFGLVTPGTSLLVLESLNQYVEHSIEPPASLPEMRREYREMIALRGNEEKARKEERLQYVLSLWQKRLNWWEQEFSYPPGFRYLEQLQKNEMSGVRERSQFAPAASMPAPSPVPAAESPRQAGMAMRADRPLRKTKKSASSAEDEDQEAQQQSQATIHITPWDPETPYLKRLKRTAPAARTALYRELRHNYGSSPAFFLDCADFFLREGDRATALRILSNIAELELENPALLRILAHRLEQMDLLDLAASLFEEVLAMRPEEPQSHRDLALVLSRRAGNTGKEAQGNVQADYRRAVDLLNHVVMNQWDRFDEIELIALTELNNIIPKARKAGVDGIPVDPRLVRPLVMDVRIVLTWDMDMTDLDLWVTEPSGEKCFYSHNLTTIGGSMSRDITNGYGPEEYVLRKGMKGNYRIEANYYGSNAPELAGTATLQAEVFTNYGRPNEERRAITLRLTQKQETVSIGEVTFGRK